MNEYRIPADWLIFCEIATWQRRSDLYPWSPSVTNVERVAIVDIEPPRRDAGMAKAFRKNKLVPVLLAFTSDECALPPIALEQLPPGSPFKYRVTNGFHRFYASRHVGYTSIPAVIRTA
jgi:hypothetical protein